MNRAMAASESSKVQSTTMVTFTVLFTRFFTGGREEVFDRACDENDGRSKTDLGKNTKSGGCDPTCSALCRPSVSGSLPPSLKHRRTHSECHVSSKLLGEVLRKIPLYVVGAQSRISVIELFKKRQFSTSVKNNDARRPKEIRER